MREFMHFDPITLLILVAGFISTWTVLKKDNKWHTSWILKHEKDCTDQRKVNNELFTKMVENLARITTLSEGHEKRLDRIEEYVDKARK